jgi:hypothetical protein
MINRLDKDDDLNLSSQELVNLIKNIELEDDDLQTHKK